MTARCVLIVDRAPAMARMLMDVLADAGWGAEVATRLGDALDALEERQFCAVVSEVEIPDGDGFELLTRVRDLPAPPVVILTTFYPSPALSRRAVGAGAFGYLSKPFDVEALVEMLEDACGGLVRA